MTDEPDATPRPDSSLAPSGGATAPDAAAADAARPGDQTSPRVEPVGTRPARRVLPMLSLAGFIVLAGAIAYLWTRQVPVPPMPVIPPDQSGVVAALKNEVASLQSSLQALDARERSDVAALHEAINALPTPSAPPAPAPAAGPPAPVQPSDNGLNQQIAALAGRVNQLQAAQSAQAQQAQSLPSASTVASLSSRVDAIAQRQAGDDDSLHQALTALKQEVASLSGQAKTLAQDTSTLPQLSAQSDKLSRLVRLQEALRAGQPLGNIPNAPPALARFASAAPPTEAALRLSFPDAARLAEKAGQPVSETGGFWHRIWLHVQDLVTVRRGDKVLVGDPTSGVLAHAQRLLDAGDLAGALSVLDTLSGPAAVAMAPWEAQAKALVDARQALAQMAAG